MNKYVIQAAVVGFGLLGAVRAQASLSGGPGIIAWKGHYNLASTDPYGGGGCINNPDNMPTGRKTACGFPQVVKTATGRYTITVTNAAPFPTITNDSGYQVFVQAVGGTAHCIEESTIASTSSPYTLTSKVRCIAPSSSATTNTNVDSEWAWSYRADSLNYPQESAYAGNFAYARITGSNGALVTNQTFNPNTSHVVTSTRTSTGVYNLVFKDLYEHAYDYGYHPDLDYLNNIVVQKTCTSDSSSSCLRSVCIPHSWAPGSFIPHSPGSTYDTSVTVRCYGPDGNLRNTDFRVFAGEESHVSAQREFDPWESTGWQYGWLNFTNSSSNTCYSPYDFVHRSIHEDNTYLSEPIEVCKTGTGRYTMNFDPNVGPYHVDDMIPVVSGRATGGAYCNPHKVNCVGGNCSGSGPDQLLVRCYTRAGAALNASWNMSMFY